MLSIISYLPHSRGRRPLYLVALIAIVLAAFSVAAPSALAEERTFSIEEIHVVATVLPNGLVDVREFVTYEFRGADSQPFRVGSRDFVKGSTSVSQAPDGEITHVSVYKDGEPLEVLVATQNLIEWDIYPARSGRHTYELRYSLANAVTIGSDVAEFYRQWVGPTSPSVNKWSAEISVPGGSTDVRVWAHGPLDGTIYPEDPGAIAQIAQGSRSGEFIETRVAIPVNRFTFPPGERELLPDILAEEQAWADEANAKRQAVIDAENRRARVEEGLNWAIGPILLWAAGGFYLIWNRWGRDPKKPADIGYYWREVPNDPPAVAQAFLSWGTVAADGYSATVLDLARRGYMRIEEVLIPRKLRKDTIDHRFIRLNDPTGDQLTKFERDTLAWMFKYAPIITQDELVKQNRKHQSAAANFWKTFQGSVASDLKGRNYTQTGKGWAFFWHFLIVAGLFGIAFIALKNEAWIAMLLAAIGALVLIPMALLHRARTVAGARRLAEWTGLRQFMKDFSRLDEAPVGHLALWEHYLVAAVALGVADELIKGLTVQFPELMDPNSAAVFAPWYVASATSTNRLANFNSFASQVGTSSISSFTPPSSGSGSGGGFSGGGGGGGGGGGFGAR